MALVDPVALEPMALLYLVSLVDPVATAQMVVAVVPVAWVARLFPPVFPARTVPVATEATVAPLVAVVAVVAVAMESMLLD